MTHPSAITPLTPAGLSPDETQRVRELVEEVLQRLVEIEALVRPVEKSRVTVTPDDLDAFIESRRG